MVVLSIFKYNHEDNSDYEDELVNAGGKKFPRGYDEMCHYQLTGLEPCTFINEWCFCN